VHYPVKGGRLINVVAIVHDEWNETGWSAEGSRDEILRHFARWSWADKARDLLAIPNQWLKWALYERDAPFKGGVGPVTLIGDAAHPMLPFLGQGAGMAIEDAAVVASMLGKHIEIRPMRCAPTKAPGAIARYAPNKRRPARPRSTARPDRRR